MKRRLKSGFLDSFSKNQPNLSDIVFEIDVVLNDWQLQSKIRKVFAIFLSIVYVVNFAKFLHV